MSTYFGIKASLVQSLQHAFTEAATSPDPKDFFKLLNDKNTLLGILSILKDGIDTSQNTSSDDLLHKIDICPLNSTLSWRNSGKDYILVVNEGGNVTLKINKESKNFTSKENARRWVESQDEYGFIIEDEVLTQLFELVDDMRKIIKEKKNAKIGEGTMRRALFASSPK